MVGGKKSVTYFNNGGVTHELRCRDGVYVRMLELECRREHRVIGHRIVVVGSIRLIREIHFSTPEV